MTIPREELLATIKSLPAADMLWLAKETLWAVTEEVGDDIDLTAQYRECDDLIDTMAMAIAEHRQEAAERDHDAWIAELSSDYRSAA